MPVYRITYRPELDRPAELVEGDQLAVEGEGHVVIRRDVVVIGCPRDVVVRRFRGADLLDVSAAEEQPRRRG